jgi:hypothetical protein
MPGKILQPRSLDFNPDQHICIRTSCEAKLLFLLFAFKFRRESTYRKPLRCSVFDCLNPPNSASIHGHSKGARGQAFNTIEMAPVESPNRIVFHQGNCSYSCLIGPDIETKDALSHL